MAIARETCTTPVRCSTPGCEIVIGNGTHGARAPRPCCRCALRCANCGVTLAYHGEPWRQGCANPCAMKDIARRTTWRMP